MDRRVEKIMQEVMQEVHESLKESLYNNDTSIRDNTNCYAFAIGATYPNLEIYRIGNICGKKQITESYFSIEEIKELLYSDLEVLDLKIEESTLEEEVLENQHKIILFAKVWKTGQIADYHFYRCYNNIWKEKWRGRKIQMIENFQRDRIDKIYPWSIIGIFKVTK